ncbi:MAG: hypothetical protein ABI549_04080 [Flavobacterium sp.]|uniref:hypothetical protein n=1 Tax=Flavobacterium sp. TaxID=239 RepID=UPI003266C84B
METAQIRKKLIKDFSKFIQDDTKLEVLEGVFDAINNEENISLVSDEHYNIVSEAREDYFSTNKKTNSWEEVELRLNHKYGF